MFFFNIIYRGKVVEIIKFGNRGWGIIVRGIWEEDVVNMLKYICECFVRKRYLDRDINLRVIII